MRKTAKNSTFEEYRASCPSYVENDIKGHTCHCNAVWLRIYAPCEWVSDICPRMKHWNRIHKND